MNETKITVRDNGSLKVEGPVTIVDAEGTPWPVAEGSAVFLCRCGQSQTKPFCDGSHKATGFQSVARASEAEGR